MVIPSFLCCTGTVFSSAVLVLFLFLTREILTTRITNFEIIRTLCVLLVAGHDGKLILGEIGGAQVIVMKVISSLLLRFNFHSVNATIFSLWCNFSYHSIKSNVFLLCLYFSSFCLISALLVSKPTLFTFCVIVVRFFYFICFSCFSLVHM